MKKYLWVSKNVFLISEHVFKSSCGRNLIQYLQDTMRNSCVLNVFLNVFLLIEDSKEQCLGYIFKSQKHVLRLGIHSLRPKDTFPFPGYNFRTIRTTLKNHSKSWPWFLLYFTFRMASKGAKIGSFWESFFAIFSILGHDIKNRFWGWNNLIKYYKKHYKC